MHIYRKYNLSIYKMQKFTATRLSIQVRRAFQGLAGGLDRWNPRILEQSKRLTKINDAATTTRL